MPDSQTYTVKQIAQKLTVKRPDLSLPKLMRQIRHWTALDYLTTIGSKHTGTGVSRLYGPNEVPKALILVELYSRGISLSEFEEFGDFLDFNIKHYAKAWEDALAGKKPIFLMLYFGLDGECACNFETGKLDLKAIYKQDDTLGTMPELELTTAVVVNMTRLFSTLR